MAKKIICFISFGLSMLILLMYLITTFMAPGDDYKPMLLILLLVLPFLILGLIAGLKINKKIMATIFMILSGLAAAFLGLMCLTGGMGFLGIIALPLGIVVFILYLISMILTIISKK